MFKKIPSHWNLKKLSNNNVADIIMGQSPPSSTYNENKEGLPFYQGKTDFGDFSPKVRIWCNKPVKIVEPDDVLISVRAPVGPSNYCVEKSCIGRGLCAIRAKSSTLPKYIYYFFKFYEPCLSNQGHGSTFDSINKSFLENLELPIPSSLQEQEEIVKILDDAANMVRLRKECLQHTEDLTPAIFNEMFGDPDNNQKNLSIHSIQEYVKVNPAKPKIEDLTMLVTFLAMKDVSENGQIIGGETKQASELNKGFTCFQEDDVLLAKITPCFENGKGTIARDLTNRIGFGSTEFHVLRPINDEILSEYLFYLLRTDHFKTLGARNMKGAAGQKRVPRDFIENYKFSLPSIETQKEFAQIAREIDVYKKQQYQELKYAENLFQSLLQRAFTGELTTKAYQEAL